MNGNTCSFKEAQAPASTQCCHDIRWWPLPAIYPKHLDPNAEGPLSRARNAAVARSVQPAPEPLENRLHLVLFSMQDRTIGPCLAANNRTGTAAMAGSMQPAPEPHPNPLENRIHLVLFGMQHRTLGPYLAANNRTGTAAGYSAIPKQP
jgi:hypothetical protein